MVHHWQAIYKHAFYRGGPILTSALSGIDQALWDIKGKALGVPVYELLGGPTRDRIRVYAHGDSVDALKAGVAKGFTAFKTGPAKKRPARYIETPAAVQYAAEKFAELRHAVGDEIDIAIDFHGAISPATAKLLIKALEPYQPMVVEEIVNCQEHDVMAENIPACRHWRARVYEMGLPRSTGEACRDHTAAGFVPRRRHHRGAADCRHGRGLLRDHRATQSAGTDFARRRSADGGLHSELPVPGTSITWRGLPQEAVYRPQRLSRPAYGPGAGH